MGPMVDHSIYQAPHLNPLPLHHPFSSGLHLLENLPVNYTPAQYV
jgi:hypothetical protein